MKNFKNKSKIVKIRNRSKILLLKFSEINKSNSSNKKLNYFRNKFIGENFRKLLENLKILWIKNLSY